MNKIKHCFENNTLTFSAEGFAPTFRTGGDFWRMHLDYCDPTKNCELGVYSHAQTPTHVLREEGKTVITYDRLIAEDGSEHKITLILTVSEREGNLYFSAELQNDDEVRVNELQYPFLEFTRLCGGFEEDVLYMPCGLGERRRNPHGFVEGAHTEYMAADYKNIFTHFIYPGQMSMPWLGIQSGDRFLYLGHHTEQCRLIMPAIGCEPRECNEESIILTLGSFPAALCGERLIYGEFCVSVTEDWRRAADVYKAYAEKTWLEVLPKKNSIRELQGWQRIILKHQYGEIFNTYDELPKIYEEGLKYGLNMILLFAWWREGMDNGYPAYEPDEALGGADALRAAIKKINEMGGKVLLYANGHLIDMATDYYKSEGYKYTMKDIDGNDYEEFYKFSNNGSLLRLGHKSFVTGCFATDGWLSKLDEITKKHLSLGSNGTFYDQVGTCMRFCFDKTHGHGNRIDLDAANRVKWVKHTKKMLTGDDWFGTEWVVDRITPYMDFTHGCGAGMTYTPEAYPYIFRYVYPAAAVSNRYIHDEKKNYRHHLNYAFVFGLLFDVSIYRGRAGTIERAPEYAAQVKELIDLRRKYLPFFTDGAFDLPDEELPERVWGAKYTLDGKSILTVWNNGTEDVTFHGRTVKKDEVTVITL